MRSVIPTRSSRAPSGLQTAALLGVVGLAASLAYVQSKKRDVERENPPQGKFVDVDGVRLHYTEHGEGQPLVLLHGNGVYSKDFDLSGVSQGASRPYRIINFDRPGFGYSDRPSGVSWTPEEQAKLFYKALHQLGIERPILVAHSWGTLVALAMALDYPKYIRAITLVSGYYYPSARSDVALLSGPAIPGIGHLMRYTVAPLLGRMMWPRLIKRMFAPAEVPARFQDFPTWMALRPGQMGASAEETAMMVPAASRLSKRYGELTLPIALIAGEGDKITDFEHNALSFKREVPHSELIAEPGVGHMAHYADPDRIMQAVAQLEDSLTPGGANLRHPATTATSSTSLH